MTTSTASVISVSELFFFCFVFVFQTSKDTTDIGAIQKAADFVQAFLLGFEVEVSVLGCYLHHVFDRCMCHNILF